MNQQTRNAQKYYSEHFWFLLTPVKIYVFGTMKTKHSGT